MTDRPARSRHEGGRGVSSYSDAMVTVRATIETVPPSHVGKVPDRETRELTATADTYEAATTDLRAQVPDGWRMLYLDVDR